jgi:hypothetical protein
VAEWIRDEEPDSLPKTAPALFKVLAQYTHYQHQVDPKAILEYMREREMIEINEVHLPFSQLLSLSEW